MAVVETLSFAVAVVDLLLLLSPGDIERLDSDYSRCCCYSCSG